MTAPPAGALPPVVPTCCANEACWAAGRADEPCYGEITAIHEEWGDWGHYFVHGCEGHPRWCEAYVPFVAPSPGA